MTRSLRLCLWQNTILNKVVIIRAHSTKSMVRPNVLAEKRTFHTVNQTARARNFRRIILNA